MPLTRSVPAVGCCRSAITRSIVVLPQPEGPMKETNSPSAICRLTSDNASTLPSAVSNVSETLRTSPPSRCGEAVNCAFASAVLLIPTGSLEATNDSRTSRSSVTSGSSCFNAFGIPSAMSKYWQTAQQIARTMFAHAEIFVGKHHHRGQTYPYRFFRWAKNRSVFDLRGVPSHTLQAALAYRAGPHSDCLHASAMKPAPFKYIAATSLEHALSLKAEYGDDAKFLAGGQSLMPTMNFRLAQPAILIDLNRIGSLGGIRPGDAGGARIG